MSTNFPTQLDSFTNPTPTDHLNGPSHAGQHANANDAIEAIQAKLGIDSSAVTTSHDYKLSEITGTDKAVGETATQTLSAKTLKSPVINTGISGTAIVDEDTMTSNSATKVPTQQSVKAYVDNKKTYSYFTNATATNGISNTEVDINNLKLTFTPTVNSIIIITLVAFIDITSAGTVDAIIKITNSENTQQGVPGRFIGTGTGARGTAIASAMLSLTGGNKYTFKGRAIGTAGQTYNISTFGYMSSIVIPN